MGESSSAAPLSLKTIPMAPPLKRTPPTSTSTKCKFNDFGLPIESSDSESSGELLSKKLEIKKAGLVASSKEEKGKTTTGPLEPRKRPIEYPKAEPAKKLKTHQGSGLVVLKPELPKAIDVDDLHLESSTDPVVISLAVAARKYLQVDAERAKLQESLSRVEAESSREKSLLEKRVEEAEKAMKLAQNEAEAAKKKAEESQKKLEDLEKRSKSDLEKANKYSEKVEGRLRVLAEKISAFSGVPLGLTDVDGKTEELLANMKTSLERWFENVYPEAEMPASLAELLQYFSAPADPQKVYRNKKLKEGAESALLMALSHGVDKKVLEKVAESFPTDAAGKEVDIAPFAKLSGRLAKRIIGYLNERKERLARASAQSSSVAAES